MKTMKTNMIKKLVTLSCLMILALPIFAGDVNNSAAAYIRMGIGARIIAMGEAGTATAKDVTAAYWNPAGLSYLKDIEFTTTYALNMGYDRTHQHAAVAKRFGFGVLALSWINAGVSDIIGTDASNNDTGVFSNSENNIALSYAHRYKKLSYGISPKLYTSSIDGDTEMGFGLDLGAKYDINQYLEAGIMLRDIYGTLADDAIPYQIQAGVTAYPFLGVTLAADMHYEKEEDPYFIFGAEYWTSIGRDTEADSKLSVLNVQERNAWADLFSHFQTGLRVGFNDNRFSAGAGIRFRNFQIDYAYRIGNHDIFGDDHLLGLILRF
ncbi:MAG: hypothetical protein M0Q19_09075 [Candidatus Cloacimonetes bacterium]|nr:hypothetical protein [Candidatus Cloacimonadota bacterium]